MKKTIVSLVFFLLTAVAPELLSLSAPGQPTFGATNLVYEASSLDGGIGIDLLDKLTGQLALTARPPQRRVGRPGAVRLEGRSFADDAGSWNPLGASLFWSLWGEKHDPERLNRNLRHLAEHGVDYVRVLGMAGAAAWKGRVIDPTAPDYWQTVDKFFDRLERHGLRVQVTLFADAQVMMPAREDRRVFAERWARFVNSRLRLVQSLEVANEGWQNGFDDVAHLREIGRLLAEQTSVPVALSSAPHEPPSAWCDIYARSAADFVTLHYDRDMTRAGPWRPVGQPWGFAGEYDGSAWGRDVAPWQCGGQLPRAAVSNEPIGPQSSVAEDADPIRLAMSYATTFVAGNAAYVYHTGAGIQGGGPIASQRGRRDNVYDYDPAILDALAAMRRLLPPGIANWQRHNAQAVAMPFAGLADTDKPQDGVGRRDLGRAYAAISGNRFVLVLLGIERPFQTKAKQPMTFTVYSPLDGSVVSTHELAAGQAWAVPAGLPGLVVIGTRR